MPLTSVFDLQSTHTRTSLLHHGENFDGVISPCVCLFAVVLKLANAAFHWAHQS